MVAAAVGSIQQHTNTRCMYLVALRVALAAAGTVIQNTRDASLSCVYLVFSFKSQALL